MLRRWPKVLTASPASYVDVPFTAQAGVPYHLWLRLKAQNNSFSDDSVYVQFSRATDAGAHPVYAIGSTSAASVILEEGSGAGMSGWGWNDNAYGSLAAPLYFAASGPQTMRIQAREDGPSIDQVVLSPSTFLIASPGTSKNDTTIVPKP
jgi:hypothetical protein